MNIMSNKQPEKSTSLIWIVSLGLLAIAIILNEYFHVYYTPVTQKVIFPWHLQGLFNWYLSTGGLILLMIPLYFDLISGRHVRGVGLAVVASMFVAISIFSRGSVVFELIIILTSWLVYRSLIRVPSKSEMLKIALIITICLALSVVVSQMRREAFFSQVQSATQPSLQPSLPSAYSLYLIFKLPLERWVDLEGVMAVSSHSGKGSDLLRRAISEPRVTGEVDMYTHEVALAPTKDTKTVMYATPPGAFAFLYYSGSYLVVFVGMAFFSVVMVQAEYIIKHISANPFLSGAIGVGGGIEIIHMGTGGLLMPAIVFMVSFLFAIFIGRVVSYFRSKVAIS